MSSICFIIPYFAKRNFFWQKKPKFPPYFSYFIKTFSGNTSNSIDLKLITNIPFQEYEKYQGDNISVIRMSWSDLIKLISTVLGLKVHPFQFRAYKLCDLKPAFGLIFSEYLQGYDFWGYCDVDMIIGNLGNFLTEANLREYEMISASKGNPGYMTIYRNDDKINHLFTKSPDYLKVFQSTNSYRFDEKGRDNIIALKQIVEQQQVKINNISGIVHNDSGGFNQNRPWKYIWQNGTLTDALTGEEIGSLHIVKSKRRPNFLIEPIKEGNISIEITENGINCY
jgi:hypothetical protein